MSVGNKKTLATVVYYTLAALAIISSGFFTYALVIRDVAMWAKVVYFIWIAAVFGVVIYDIICTRNGEGKTTAGFIIYVLSLLAIIMAVILYFMNSGVAGLATSFFNLFISISFISLMTTGYMIATWCVGESLIEHSTSNKELENSKM